MAKTQELFFDRNRNSFSVSKLDGQRLFLLQTDGGTCSNVYMYASFSQLLSPHYHLPEFDMMTVVISGLCGFVLFATMVLEWV